ncbi:hypothetical protein NIES4071_88980 [Calothrix sp. NIES-4071]|nr:hypothetical protein NIES4071_88980 [Calothrix sp. NIES-4071]BAZ63165.1 hypothetical protein NIES4105_88910 [Calothrix sp. NIES-4105]
MNDTQLKPTTCLEQQKLVCNSPKHGFFVQAPASSRNQNSKTNSKITYTKFDGEFGE